MKRFQQRPSSVASIVENRNVLYEENRKKPTVNKLT